MPIPNQAWLAQGQESALEPDLPICDPHHHLWVHDANPYMLPEVSADVGSGHKVVSTVFVECTSGYRADGPEAMRPVGETDFVEAVANESAADRHEATIAAGIVSYADLTAGETARDVLEAHQAASDRFRGIRHAASWNASPSIRNAHTNPPAELYRQANFQAGFAALTALDLTFDAWLYHPQIPELTDLARAFPGARIVLDHVGGPLGIGPYADRQAEIFPSWQASITELARCENVHVKLGGLVMPVNGFGWHKQATPPSSEALCRALEPYFMHCIEQFGPDRCMFESNFPVDKVSCSYNVLWNAFKRMTTSFGAGERAALFHDTACAFYRV